MLESKNKILIIDEKSKMKSLDSLYSKALSENRSTGNKYDPYFLLLCCLCNIVPDFFDNCDIPLVFGKVYPVRFYNIMDDKNESIAFIFIKYDKRFIHIPKTGGKYMIENYMNFQAGGNHLSANINSLNYHLYCEDFNSCYTVVRNPFSWLFSYYNHKDENSSKPLGHGHCRKIKENKTFEKFIFNICNLDKDVKWFPYSQGMTSQIFNSKNQICVSNIVYFEKYIAGLDHINLEKIPHDISNLIVRDKKFNEFKYSDVDYRKYYTSDMIKEVERKFKFDLDFLGYDFEGIMHDYSHINIKKQITKDEIIKLSCYI